MTSKISTTKQLVQLMQAGKLHPDGFLDILEWRLEESRESVNSDDLYDLWRSGRLSDAEFVEFSGTGYDDVEKLPKNVDPLQATYDVEPLEEK